jgi:hypothetical protein
MASFQWALGCRSVSVLWQIVETTRLLMIWYWHQYDVAATLCGHKLIRNSLYP